MKHAVHHQLHRQSSSAAEPSQVQSLLQTRSELTVLIKTMEEDKTLRPSPWQIGSLRRTLQGVEERIKTVFAESDLPVSRARRG